MFVTAGRNGSAETPKQSLQKPEKSLRRPVESCADDDEPKRSPEFNLRHDWNSLINGADDGGKSLLFTNYS